MVKAFCRMLFMLLIQKQAVSRQRHCRLGLFSAADQTLQLQTPLGPSSQTLHLLGRSGLHGELLVTKNQQTKWNRVVHESKTTPRLYSLAIL